MKKYILLLFILLIGSAVFITSLKSNKPSNSGIPSLPSEPEALETEYENFVKLNRKERILNIIYFPLAAGSTVRLIPNFTEKKYSTDIVMEQRCRYASNGGFYTAEDKPLGLFFTEGTQYGEKIDGSVATGYFFIGKDGTPGISSVKKELNPKNYQHIFQTGPFFTAGNYAPGIKEDEQARRIVALEDKDGTIYIAAVFEDGQNFSGPLLSELPEIFSSSEMSDKLKIKNLLNLDGGSASYFFINSEEGRLELNELTPVGSIICIK